MPNYIYVEMIMSADCVVIHGLPEERSESHHRACPLLTDAALTERLKDVWGLDGRIKVMNRTRLLFFPVTIEGFAPENLHDYLQDNFVEEPMEYTDRDGNVWVREWYNCPLVAVRRLRDGFDQWRPNRVMAS